MDPKIIGIKFKNKSGTYNGKTYHYYCDIPVDIGSLVITPSAQGESTGRVVEVNVPPSKIEERVLPLLKTVTALAEEDEDIQEEATA